MLENIEYYIFNENETLNPSNRWFIYEHFKLVEMCKIINFSFKLVIIWIDTIKIENFDVIILII